MKPYYERGGIVIYHGDCREVLPSIEQADLVLTDPPYSHQHMDGGGLAGARRFYLDGAVKSISQFVLADYGEIMLATAPMLIAFHSRDLIPDYGALARKAGRKYDLHFWWKTNAIPFTAHTWKSDVEYIALIWDRNPGWKQLHQSAHSKCWSSSINAADTTHPAAKPIALLRKYISVLDATSICDPFMGSGTTLRAAMDLGRRAIGIEIEERYCEIAAKRLQQDVLPLWGPDLSGANTAELGAEG